MEKVKISREEQVLLKRLSASRISDYPSELPGSGMPQMMAQILVSTQRCLDRPLGVTDGRGNSQAECYSFGTRFSSIPSKENLESLLVTVLRRSRKEWCPLPLLSLRDTPSMSSRGIALRCKLSCPATRGKRFLKALSKYFLRAQDLAIRSGVGILFRMEKGPLEICGEDAVVAVTLFIGLSSFVPQSSRLTVDDILLSPGPASDVSLVPSSFYELLTDRSGRLPICKDSLGAEEEETILGAVSPDPKGGVKRALAVAGGYCDLSAAVLALDSLSSLVSTLVKREYYPF